MTTKVSATSSDPIHRDAARKTIAGKAADAKVAVMVQQVKPFLLMAPAERGENHPLIPPHGAQPATAGCLRILNVAASTSAVRTVA